MYANPQELLDCERITSDSHPETLDANNDRFYIQKQQVQLPDNLRALRVLNAYCPNRGKLLEIGCFLGLFLEQIRNDGWDATGLEPDRSVGKLARGRGLTVIEGLLQTAPLPDHAFDAVIMLHVIEHMPDPNEDLRIIHRILKPGGMVAIETPRFDSLSFKLLRHRERSIQNCNGHVQFFTTDTLSRLLEKNGFEVLRTDLVGRTMTAERLLFNVGLVSRNDRVKRGLDGVSRSLHLDKVRLHVSLRDMQRVYCRAR